MLQSWETFSANKQRETLVTVKSVSHKRPIQSFSLYCIHYSYFFAAEMTFQVFQVTRFFKVFEIYLEDILVSVAWFSTTVTITAGHTEGIPGIRQLAHICQW